MASITGALSGTKVFLEIEQVLDAADYIQLPGETSHTLSDTLEAIEITNKSLADFREFLEGEGRRLLDVSIEAINNTATAYRLLYTAYDAKLFVRLRRVAGTRTIISQYMITAISDNPSLNTAVADSFTLSSHGVITVS